MANLCHFLVLVLASYASAQDYVDECPEPNGFYADAVQCDRYYECKDSQVRIAMPLDGQYVFIRLHSLSQSNCFAFLTIF